MKTKLNRIVRFLTRPHSWTWRIVLVMSLTGVILSGCRSNSTEATTSAPTGTYTLATINGNQLPFTPPHEGGAPQVQSGAITLNDDGTFTSKMTYRMPAGQVASKDFSGTYTCTGSQFTLRWTGAGQTRGTVVTNSFTMENEGVLFTYLK